MKKLMFISVAIFFCASTFAQDSLRVKSLFHWSDESLPASSAHNNVYNEIWGVTLEGREYAIIGTTMGTNIFDVTDPGKSVEVAFIPGKDTGPKIIHRDYHDYNGYLYAVSDEGASSLQIIDLKSLPESAPVVYDSDSMIITSHNIFIDTANARLYSAVSRDLKFGRVPVAIFSLEDPINPTRIGEYSPPNNQQTHDLYVKDNIGYCHNAFQGMTIVDFTNPENPVEKGRLDSYPDKDYNHSGWLMDGGKYYAFADEAHGEQIKILDVEDPTNISVVSLIYSGVHPDSSMAHNLIFKDSFLYVSYYHDGMYVFNLSDPANPFIAGYYDTYTRSDHGGYRGNWGVYPHFESGNILASDMQFGLFVFDVSEALTAERPPSTGIKNIENGDLNIFPNPAGGLANVNLNSFEGEEIVVSLVSIAGKVIKEIMVDSSTKNLTLNLEGVSSGIYMVKAVSSNKVFTGKLVKR